MQHTNIIIIGGGLAGLTSALQLAQHELDVVLIEKKEYPFHRVCGEYISNEVRPFLERLDIFPQHLGPTHIDKLLLTSTRNHEVQLDLPLGGFGISRYRFDYFLFQQAREMGVNFITRKYVSSVVFDSGMFQVTLNDQERLTCDVVIGAFGKRSNLDRVLERPFMKRRSPYVGVKYHMKGEFPRNLIALHNFQGGYAGISAVEDQKLNLCYLASGESLKTYGNIKALERRVLMKNAFLRKFLTSSETLFKQPLVINEISFERKLPVEQHILMCGDAAGMIAPLCGNGMAMAIRSGSLLVPLVLKFFAEARYSRYMLELDYSRVWNHHFRRRLWNGRTIQRLFGTDRASVAAVKICKNFPLAAKYLVRQTHGDTF